MARSLLFVLGVFLSSPSSATLPVPSPGNSSVGACLLLDPTGAFPFAVTVRDYSNFTLAGSVVTIDLCACPAVVLCPSAPGAPRLNAACTVTGITDAGGTHTFAIKGGGGCSAEVVRIYADGVLLATRRVASTDQDADLQVTAADAALLAARLGSSDLTGDLDCDGAVTVSDQVVLNSHLGGTCLPPTPARRGSWGDLKIRYR